MFAVASNSAQVSRTRPFYADHAQAYDQLLDDPVEPWVQAVQERLAKAGWRAAAVLDAGCGTGRHAAALAAKGHRVDLADAAPDLLVQAADRIPGARAMQVDLCALELGPIYQAVTCRGVLNDMTTDAERDAVLRSFAEALYADGLLFLDVREQEASRRRADGEPRRRTADLGPRGRLEFTSTSTWQDGLLQVTEQYELHPPLDSGAPVERSEYAFAMRPWTESEIHTRLAVAGFRNVEIEPGVGRRNPDRLFVVATR